MLGAGVLGILAFICLLVSLVMWIMVLIRQFKDAGPVHGIIGILCGLWTFIWGWMNASRLNIRNLMLIWTAALVLYFILSFMSGGMAMMYGGSTAPTTP